MAPCWPSAQAAVLAGPRIGLAALPMRSVMRPQTLVCVLAAAVLAAASAGPVSAGQADPSLRFVVTLDPSLPAQPPGRLLVVMVPAGRSATEPRFLIGRAGSRAVPTLGVDAPPLEPGDRVTVGASGAAFPLETLRDLPADEYRVQAVLATNPDIRRAGAPGNLYGDVRLIELDPERPTAVQLRLTRRIPDERLPDDTELLRFVRIRSERLSAFHGRPIHLRAGVILPPGHDEDAARRYPLRVRIGGYGARYTGVRRMMRPGSRFRTAWLDPDAPRFVLLHLDGAGPYGDPYQVDSANSGPYGAAVTEELIPWVEERFRAGGSAGARVLDGGSTGGWVALALQILYPDFFGGAWASCPDSVDFRAFQLVDVYRGGNAYVDGEGRELPSARNLDGSTRFTMRHELRMENVLGHGDSWTRSGGQWGAWNAVYGPRGADGLPVPLWDPASGEIDTEVTTHWERYDLRLVLERGWDTLAPKLRGRLNIWVGDMDDYFLDGAVRRLDAFLQGRPSIEARIVYGPGRGHCWTGISPAEMLREMAAQVERAGR